MKTRIIAYVWARDCQATRKFFAVADLEPVAYTHIPIYVGGNNDPLFAPEFALRVSYIVPSPNHSSGASVHIEAGISFREDNDAVRLTNYCETLLAQKVIVFKEF